LQELWGRFVRSIFKGDRARYEGKNQAAKPKFTKLWETPG